MPGIPRSRVRRRSLRSGLASARVVVYLKRATPKIAWIGIESRGERAGAVTRDTVACSAVLTKQSLLGPIGISGDRACCHLDPREVQAGFIGQAWLIGRAEKLRHRLRDGFTLQLRDLGRMASFQIDAKGRRLAAAATGQ